MTQMSKDTVAASIERALAAQGKSPHEATLAEMDALWDAAKAAEREEK